MIYDIIAAIDAVLLVVLLVAIRKGEAKV